MKIWPHPANPINPDSDKKATVGSNFSRRNLDYYQRTRLLSVPILFCLTFKPSNRQTIHPLATTSMHFIILGVAL